MKYYESGKKIFSEREEERKRAKAIGLKQIEILEEKPDQEELFDFIKDEFNKYLLKDLTKKEFEFTQKILYDKK